MKSNEYQRKRAARIKAKWLKGKACAECGSTEQLEIDHIYPNLKVSHKIWSWSEPRRKEELAKCQVLCKRCHKVKTKIENSSILVHGTRGAYRKGCKCRQCRDAQKWYMRIHRAKQKGESLPVE